MIEFTRLLLAAVFAVAGIAKLTDREGAGGALRDFGAPARLAAPLAFVLPLGELAVAAGLVPSASARAAAGGAVALLALFTLAIATALLRGRKPDCHCFGRLHSKPAGPGTLARNASLTAIAAIVVSQPAADPSRLELAAAGVAIVVVAQALLSSALLRRYGRALERIEELEAGTGRSAVLAVGAEAPAFALPSIASGEVTLAGLLRRARPVLLVFADPGCGPCHALMPKLADWQRSLTVAVVSRGDMDDNAALAKEHELRDLLVQRDREVSGLYGAQATPSAVLVGADGRLAQAIAVGGPAIEGLVSLVTPGAEPSPELSANGRARIATAAALAGGLAVTAAAAHASSDARSQQPTDPEVQAIDAALRAASPRLVAASQRSSKAVRAQATFKAGKTLRAKRTAARQALAAERGEVLALRATIDGLPEMTFTAHNVKLIVHNSLSLFAQSLEKRQQAIGATPKVALQRLAQGQKLFLRSVGSSAAVGELLGRGK